MHIYTSYFGNLKNIPKNVIPISICGKPPNWYKGLQYKKLAPKYEFFMEWKRNHDNSFYIKHYYEEVLNKLSHDDIIDDLFELGNGNDVVLLCYEKPDDFCHRHLVREWWNTEWYQIKEFKIG